MGLALVVDGGELNARVHAILGGLNEELEAGDASDRLDEVRQLAGDFQDEHLLGACGRFAGRGDPSSREGRRDSRDRGAEAFELAFDAWSLEFWPGCLPGYPLAHLGAPEW
jgi:hypothetical protein